MTTKKSKLPKELTEAGSVVEDFNTRIEALEENFGDNEKIASTLAGVAASIKTFDQLFEKAFVNLIKNSTDVKVAFQAFVDEGDRAATNKLLKRFGLIAVWSLSLVVTVVVTAILTKKLGG